MAAAQRLLQAIHMPIEVFRFLKQTGSPYCSRGTLAGQVVALPEAEPGESRLLTTLAHQIGAPPVLSFRVDNLCKHPLDSAEKAARVLRDTLKLDSEPLLHPRWPDVVLAPSKSAVDRFPKPQFASVMVTARAGEAVLRGAGILKDADIFATVASRLRPGSPVSVFAAARDTPVKVAHDAEEESWGDVSLASRIQQLVHLRYPRGPSGPQTLAIFVGNGVWAPPFGIRITDSPVPPFQLQDSSSRGATSFPGPVLPPGLLPQSLPSAAVVHILSPQPGEAILDLCAAPGGKAHHIAQLMQNQGCLVALEPAEPRLRRLEAFLAERGVQNCECVVADGTTWRSPKPASFDRVLVDAPCSSSGLWPRLDWKRVTREGVEELTQQQFALLETAAREVKIGGTVVYAVCSYLAQETEAVCQRALERLPLELDPPGSDGAVTVAGPEGNMVSDAMGYFIARFRRTSGPPLGARRLKRAGLERR